MPSPRLHKTSIEMWKVAAFSVARNFSNTRHSKQHPSIMNTSPRLDDEDFKAEKGYIETVENVEHLDANAADLDVKDTIKGTVGLTSESGAVVLIPTPSADPSGEFCCGRRAFFTC